MIHPCEPSLAELLLIRADLWSDRDEVDTRKHDAIDAEIKRHRREARGDPAHSITCPKCGWTSYNENDIEKEYCGNCHQFHKFLGVEDR